ncbi:DUF5683 domain-containing protein [Algivirga pacifica]|uniref:DUF5683 domain-containing protein n=1 Tax=Algivirga pacifica TaxID=1162670 RepID=A0ABP9CYN7_9BACT
MIKKNGSYSKYLLLFSVLLLSLAFTSTLYAQEETYELKRTKVGKTKFKKKKMEKPQKERFLEPTRRAFASAILPGLGQIQNRKYWKVPIIYGGFSVFSYLIRENHVRYIEFRNYALYSGDNNPHNDALIPEDFQSVSNSNFNRFKDNYRRDRDFMIILTIAWYGLNCVDAAVDAHMKAFDVSEDLSGVIKPKLLQTDRMRSPVLGLSLALNLKK